MFTYEVPCVPGTPYASYVMITCHSAGTEPLFGELWSVLTTKRVLHGDGSQTCSFGITTAEIVLDRDLDSRIRKL